MPTRNSTIDIAKGIGIILVVVGHNWLVLHEKGEIHRVIFSFHIPLFFFLAGVFLRESDSLKSLASSKADALLKPYLVVLLLAGLGNTWLGSTSWTKYLLGVVYATGGTIAWNWEPLWFLPHLLLALLFSWVIVRAFGDLKNNPFWMAAVALSLLVIGAAFIDAFWQFDVSRWVGPGTRLGARARLPGLPFSLDIVAVSSGFVLLGFATREHVRALRFRRTTFLAALLVFSLLHYRFDHALDLNLRQYGSVPISSLQAILGIYIVISIAALVNKSKVFGKSLAYIGSCSLFILIFHFAAQASSFQFLSRLIQAEQIAGILAFVVGMTFPIALLEVTKRRELLSALLLPRRSRRSLHRNTLAGR